MLDRIISFSLHNRLLVAAAAVAVAAFGTLAALRMPVDVLPDLDRPVVTVLTEAPGMVPEDVEQLVTWPLEQVLVGASGVVRVRSSSTPGLSVVWAEFDWGVDIYRARQIVSEKLVHASVPPPLRPEMAPIASIMGQVLVIGFRLRDGADGLDQAGMRRMVDRDVVPRLLSLPGVAQVVSTGARATELTVVADALRLRAHGVTLPQLSDAVDAANRSANAAPMARGAQAPPVAVSGRLQDPDELAQAVVVRGGAGGRPVLVRDVAEVGYGPATVGVGDAGVDGEPGVLVVVTKQPGVDTVDLTERIEREIGLLAPAMPAGVEVVHGLFRQADFIHRAIDNVMAAVRDGAVLVVVVLFLFLLEIRTTLITLTAIPLSVAIAALVFAAFGLTINTMTLGGLAVAVGTLVDDAIVDVENVSRRLLENRQRSQPRRVLEVVFAASREVRRPVTYGTLLVTVVYLPLFFLSGIEGRLFVPIGLAYVVSVVASLLVALTVTPMLCSVLLGGVRSERSEHGGRAVRALRAGAERLARLGIARTGHVLGMCAAVVLCAVAFLLSLGATLLPPFQEGAAQANLMLPPDAGLATADAFGRRVERVLLAVDGIEHVARRTGRAEGDEHAMPVSVNEVLIRLADDSGRGREEILEDIRARLATEFPGLDYEVEQPLAHLLSHMLSGVNAQVAVKLAGPDVATLRELAGRAEQAIAGIPGVRDLYVEPLVRIDAVEVRPRRDAMARLGVAMADVAETVRLALGGGEASRLRLGRVSYAITVQLRAEDRQDLAALRELRVPAAEATVRLGDVAEVRLVRTPNELRRENGERRLVVQHNVAGRALGDVVADVDRALGAVRRDVAALPGYTVRIAGQFEAQQQATRTILSLSIAAMLGTVLILHLHLRSMVLVLLVLLTRPIALVGAAAAVAVTGQDLSVATLIGFIALLGMATRNAILLVDHAIDVMREQGAFSTEAIVRAARERVVPVMMTALTGGIGLLPLALAPDQPGRELLYPVATVVIGGLVTNTVLDFLLTPGLLATVARRALERQLAGGDEG